MKRWHNLAQERSVASRRTVRSGGLKRAALCLSLALGAGGCFGGPHPIPPEVFGEDPNAEGPDFGISGNGGASGAGGGSGGTGGIVTTGGSGGFAGLGGAGGLSGQDAGDTVVGMDGGVDASIDDDAGSLVQP